MHWHQDNDVNDHAKLQQLIVPTPKACEIYYYICSTVDPNNSHLLQLETKIEMTNSAKRVETTILWMWIIDEQHIYQGAMNMKKTQVVFYTWLVEELIDNA